MKQYKIWIILLNLLLLIVYMNWSILKKEKTLKDGVLALFELAPVDPRSLMQGDYMDLRYAITGRNWKKDIPTIGFMIIKLDENNVAQNVRYQPEFSSLKNGELLLKYHKNRSGVKLGAESFFFEEGSAEKYEKAEYGGLRIDEKGNSILVGLYDEQFQLIE